MKHPSDSELLHFAARRTAVGEAGEVRQHVAACGRCQAQVRSLQVVEEQLEYWRVPEPRGGVAERVMARLDAPPVVQRGLVGWVGMRSWMGIAAALVFAAGIGHGAGRWMWQSPPDHRSMVTEIQATEALHVEGFGESVGELMVQVVLEPEVPEANNVETEG